MITQPDAVQSRDFDGLVGPWIEPGFRLAVAMLRDPHEAEDAIQEAAMRAWRSIGRLRDAEVVGTWFLSIVANQCRSTMRRRWWGMPRFATRQVVFGGPEDSAVQTLDIDRAMQRLRPEDRAILHLFFYLDLPVEEVAGILGVSAGAAKTRLYRAVHKLRPGLQLNEEDLT